MNGHNVRVKALGGNTHVAEEPAPHVAARGNGRRKTLDRDRTFESHVSGEIHDTHDAVADLTLD